DEPDQLRIRPGAFSTRTGIGEAHWIRWDPGMHARLDGRGLPKVTIILDHADWWRSVVRGRILAFRFPATWEEAQRLHDQIHAHILSAQAPQKEAAATPDSF